MFDIQVWAASNTIRFYKETTHEEMLEFGDPSIVERKLTKHELKDAQWAAAEQADNVANVARVDAREEERRKWKAYHRSAGKARSDVSKVRKSAKESYSCTRSSYLPCEGAIQYWVVTLA